MAQVAAATDSDVGTSMRTILIAQALKARQEALRFHNMPQEANLTIDVLCYLDADMQAPLEGQGRGFRHPHSEVNVKKYEEAHRQKNADITHKIINLGVCSARAWARGSASTRSRAAYMSNAEQRR